MVDLMHGDLVLATVTRAGSTPKEARASLERGLLEMAVAQFTLLATMASIREGFDALLVQRIQQYVGTRQERAARAARLSAPERKRVLSAHVDFWAAGLGSAFKTPAEFVVAFVAALFRQPIGLMGGRP